MHMRMVDLIAKKRRGEAHTDAEIDFIISSYVDGIIPDYQMSAWMMAVCWQGMTESEVSCKNCWFCSDFPIFIDNIIKSFTFR